MTKSKPSLRNSARAGLLLKLSILLSFSLAGCSSPITPTYAVKNIPAAIQYICKNEYKINVKAKLIGQTLWIYYPVEDVFVQAEKPEKFIERFELEVVNGAFSGRELKFEYKIKAVPEQEKFQQLTYNKPIQENINNIFTTLWHVVFSMERAKGAEPQFFCLVIADIKNGFETKEIFYIQDLKKVYYQFIAREEFYHRTIIESETNPEKITGDKEGKHLEYKEITMEDFLVGQIKNRIKIKFQKPEVNRNADIDKEALKVVVHTIKIYNFKNFSAIDLFNLNTQNRTILNRAAVLASSTN